MSKKFKDHEDFFNECGKEYVYPEVFAARLNYITIEEMYQHFKSRLIAEVAVQSEELVYSAELFDTQKALK